MTHRRAVLTMVAVTLMWSIAGVVSRHIEAARGFEVTFWRSFFNAVAMVLLLGVLRGPAQLARSLREGGRTLWLSGLCWGVMYTAFMLALTLTTVANVLVLIALTPLITALAARFALGHRLAARTWGAIVLAGAGIVWMYAREVSGADARQLLGMAIGLAVPLAAALNWTLMQHNRGAAQQDMLPAVLIGALLSALATVVPALPFAATTADLGLLALLGVVQLAIPCLLAVVVARSLPAPEISLLGLLEVIFGVLWAWLGANEAPSASVLAGGALVLAALAGNELLALRERRL
ncbi:MAG: DMT family transporter [Proteobacteria bacterium]|uniref:DMT family transporter n=1 Tax=Piscinibacter sp. TaxID=1903157 RepID=UPI001B7755E1|nr:DMT family transporter [Piscinibacter sp.]MBP6027989.1 DMT family transporter [Piscinibacter sp.]MBS0443070.1 DMT family transporter [Pseudomonadota bacterium]